MLVVLNLVRLKRLNSLYLTILYKNKAQPFWQRFLKDELLSRPYLSAVMQNKIPGTNDQSSLEYNMIVMEILDAAKRSAASGKRIVL